MYWKTLKQICLYNERVDYGKQIVSRPATKLVEKHGKVSIVEISALKNVNYKPESDTMQVTMQDTMQVTIQDDRLKKLVIFCSDERTREEMQSHINIGNRDYFRRAFLKPLLESGQLKMTIPDKPNSKNQRYIKA